MEIIAATINDYIEHQVAEKDPVLIEMQAYGEKRNFPYVGPQVGRLLLILTKLLGPKKIFEVGSGFGYSAYWFAKALPAGGKVIQTEFEKAHSEKAREFFKRAGLLEKSDFLVGDGLSLLKQTPGGLDIVFLDLEKEKYPEAFRLAKGRLCKGGLLIADNTLWFGRVIEKSKDPATVGIQEFNKLLFSDPEFFSTLVPIRDGLAIGIKQ